MDAETKACACAGACKVLYLAAALLAGCATYPPQTATVYRWRTLAGQPGGLGNVDGDAGTARFCQPCSLALDSAGNLYVADYYNYAIRKVSPSGEVTTLAGSVGESGNADGVGSAARFDRPAGVAADATGTLYVADSGTHTIRKVSPGGAVTTLAGRAGETGSADATGREARFRTPMDVAVDGAGNVYVADAYNHAIRKITPAGQVSTLAGKAEMKDGAPVGGFADGPGPTARFRTPRGVAVDGAGNVYVADSDNAVIRKITAGGTVLTLAGRAGEPGYADGTNGVARFSGPQGLCVDAAGNLFVADTGNLVIRKVTPSGLVSTVTNGLARFPMPRDVVVDRMGNLYVADNDSQVISRVATGGGVSVVAGSASRHGSADGAPAEARFNRPCGIAADGAGGLLVADNFNMTLRRVAPDGTVMTLAGRVRATGSSDGAGTNANFFWPSGVARDRSGNYYVADSGNHTVRKVSPDGSVSTFAGAAGASGFADGAGRHARFSWPSDVACDRAGNVYVADRGNHAVRRVSPSGEVTTLAGVPGRSGCADGACGSALFSNPSGVAVDALGNVYVADLGNQTVRKIAPGGEVVTLAGCPGIRGSADGRGALARFNGPSDVETDDLGNVYVTDRDNHMIRKIAPDGTVMTLGGAPNAMSCADGIGREARFAQPSGIAVGPGGVLYIGDACNNRIVAGMPCVETRTVRDGMSGKAVCVPAEVEPREAAYQWEVFAGQPGQPGLADGRGCAARLSGPQGLAWAEDGSLLVADSRAGALRRVSPEGEVATLPLPAGSVRAPVALAAEAGGDVLVVDGGKALVRISRSGEVAKVGGEGLSLAFVCGVAADGAGGAVVADYNAHVLRRVAADGATRVLAGRPGQEGTVDGVGAAAFFSRPAAVARDKKGALYVATADAIRKVSPDGAVSSLGSDVEMGRLDGIAVDRSGNVYAADRGRHAIWKVAPDGRTVKLGGSELVMGGNGWLVTGLAVDRRGNVYVADAARNCIMRGTPNRSR